MTTRVLRQRPALLAVGAVACLAGCGGGPVPVDSPTLPRAAATACSALIEALPGTVGDEQRREVDGRFGAAYGDPPILVRCGVSRPAELMTDCLSVNGVDWYFQGEGKQDRIAWTVGREPVVQVRIPARYGVSADPLVDVGPAVERATTRISRCR